MSEILTRQGYVSAIDVLLHIGMLDKADYESWRRGRVPYLEKVVRGNLGKVSAVVRSMSFVDVVVLDAAGGRRCDPRALRDAGKWLVG